jgi:hypothetical protein
MYSLNLCLQCLYIVIVKLLYHELIVISIMGNDKSRHVGLRHNYVKQLLTDRVITIGFVISVQNLVDPLNYLVH